MYAAVPGSAEMPSAGRPLTREVLVDLMSAGVVVAPLVLHTGVASQESHEPPQPEWLSVPASTARLVELTRAPGGRVVAVGTTVVRALETQRPPTDASRRTTAGPSLVLGPDHPARVVTGLLTGLHEPEASHLDLLEAVAGRALVDRAYADVTAAGRAALPLARVRRLDAAAAVRTPPPGGRPGWSSARQPGRPGRAPG